MDNKREKFASFAAQLCRDEKLLLASIAQLHRQLKQYDEVLAFLATNLQPARLWSPLGADVFVQAQMYSQVTRNPAFLNLEVGVGLVVQLTPAEAREFIPKLQRLLLEKAEKLEQEAAFVHGLREKFEQNLEKLALAVNPLLSHLEF